jgi:hypothetical protein
VFAVTNLNNRKIAWMLAYPQARQAGGWPTVTLYGLASSDLKTGEGELVTLPVPKAGEGWRLPIVWSRVPATALEHYLDNLHGVIWYTNYSDEVKPTGAEPAPAANSAMTSLFHADRHSRGVAEVRRYACG